MAVIRTTRFTVDPAQADQLIARRAELINEVRAGYPGLAEARLARVSEDTWIDMWRWDSVTSMEKALAAAPTLTTAPAAFSLTGDLTAEQAVLIDER